VIQLKIEYVFKIPHQHRIKMSSPTEKKAFYRAIRYSNVPEAKKLLIKYPYLINTKTPCGHTPLMLSTIFYDNEMIEFLIGMNAKSVNEQDYHGNTVLTVAPHYSIDYFLGMGSDYTIKNNKGLTMLEQLIYDSKIEHIRVLYNWFRVQNYLIRWENINFKLIAKHSDKKEVEFNIEMFKDVWNKSVRPPIFERAKRIYNRGFRRFGPPALVSRFGNSGRS